MLGRSKVEGTLCIGGIELDLLGQNVDKKGQRMIA